MDRENPTWGEERIANELSLKLGITVSPRTVRKYLDSSRPRGTTGDQRWSTFVRNHARAVVACDFFISVTASFRILYVFVAMEIGSRWILHTNVTAHPTAEWMIQQFREFLAFDHPYQFVIHDRDRIFSPRLDQELKGFGASPEDSGSSTQGQCFLRKTDWDDPTRVSRLPDPDQRAPLRTIIKKFVCHYNRGRPHSSLGPGIPEPPQDKVPASPDRHVLPTGYCVKSTPVLGGLHHEYRLGKEAA